MCRIAVSEAATEVANLFVSRVTIRPDRTNWGMGLAENDQCRLARLLLQAIAGELGIT